MNPRACTNEAYIPTPVEHVANVATHGIWIVPSLIGSMELLRRSTTWAQHVSAYVYGTSLILLFGVSTIFHTVHYYNHNRCDYLISFSLPISDSPIALFKVIN
jgi:monocyte-to-macrophage differentiation protein